MGGNTMVAVSIVFIYCSSGPGEEVSEGKTMVAVSIVFSYCSSSPGDEVRGKYYFRG